MAPRSDFALAKYLIDASHVNLSVSFVNDDWIRTVLRHYDNINFLGVETGFRYWSTFRVL